MKLREGISVGLALAAIGISAGALSQTGGSVRSSATLRGPTGPPGPRGHIGATGPHGKVGASGAAGQRGVAGPAGAQGVAGPAGSAGSNGATGPVGPTGPAAPVASPQPTGPGGQWKVVFDDEFNGSALDTSKWTPGWFGTGVTPGVNAAELDCYDSAQVGVSGGNLNLTATLRQATCAGKSQAYSSGLVSSNGHFSYTYGVAEARILVPGTGLIADWPAFWTDGQNWPADGEDDIFEGLGGWACFHFHSLAGGPGGCYSPTFGGGWHTFTADWESGSVTYYYDGIQVNQINPVLTSAPQYLILNLAVDATYGGPIQVPATMRVDYVRVWQAGVGSRYSVGRIHATRTGARGSHPG